MQTDLQGPKVGYNMKVVCRKEWYPTLVSVEARIAPIELQRRKSVVEVGESEGELERKYLPAKSGSCGRAVREQLSLEKLAQLLIALEVAMGHWTT
jgi:hypothetical protein